MINELQLLKVKLLSLDFLKLSFVAQIFLVVVIDDGII